MAEILDVAEAEVSVRLRGGMHLLPKSFHCVVCDQSVATTDDPQTPAARKICWWCTVHWGRNPTVTHITRRDRSMLRRAHAAVTYLQWEIMNGRRL